MQVTDGCVAKSQISSSTCIICNFRSVACSKLEILAEIHMDHSKGPKRVTCGHSSPNFWRTRHDPDMRFSQEVQKRTQLSEYQITFSKKFLVFFAKNFKPSKNTRFCDYWMIRIFSGKSGRATVHRQITANFMPNFRTIVSAVIWEK